MGLLVFFLVFWVLGLCALGLGGASISWDAMDDNQNYVKECGFTRYPSLCVETLTRLGSANQPVDIVLALVNKTISETKLATSNFAKFSSQFEAQELAERAHYVTGGGNNQQLHLHVDRDSNFQLQYYMFVYVLLCLCVYFYILN